MDKKYFKFSIVFLVIGVLLFPGLIIHTNSVSVFPDSIQQKMPFSVRYAFTAGGSGTPYYLNNLIFVCGSSATYVYNSQFIEVAKLSIGNPNFLISASSSEVLFIYKAGYYIFNTTTYILSPG
ncbi:MAG: hypothetical protein ACP5L4_06815 [Thermoplasmata archaeon]